MAVVSNHAGSSDDVGFRAADAFEAEHGVNVIRHASKVCFDVFDSTFDSRVV